MPRTAPCRCCSISQTRDKAGGKTGSAMNAWCVAFLRRSRLAVLRCGTIWKLAWKTCARRDGSPLRIAIAEMVPHHIGIVACSAEGAALCYRTIALEGEQVLGAHDHPEVSMHTHSLAEYMECIYRGDWPGVGELMLSSANKLAKIGADFLICPDNTIHQALPYIAS